MIGRNERLKINPQDHDVIEWDDNAILHKYFDMLVAGDGLPDSADNLGQLLIARITDKVIVKRIQGRTFDGGPDVPHEALAVKFVRKHTAIHVPRVLRTIHAEGFLFYVMDFVDGKQLGQVWPTLSIWKKLRVAWTLRSYIRQLRRIDSTLSSVPGPLGDKPQLCDGFIFNCRYEGPFPDLAALSRWCHKQVAIGRSRFSLPRTQYDPFKDCERMVFTHLDLNMRNIMLGKDGRLWIIDWDWSGFYPEWFEYLSMSYAGEDGPASWKRCIPFIADPYIERLRWYQFQG